jgi:hypothetical protein
LRLFDGRLQLDKLRLRFLKLLIEVGGGDRRKHVAFFHMRADVEMPRGHVAAGACEQGSRVEGVHIARQNQLRFGRTAFGLDEPHGRNRLFVGPGGDFLPAPGAIRNAEDGQTDRAQRRRAKQKQNAARPGSADG